MGEGFTEKGESGKLTTLVEALQTHKSVVTKIAWWRSITDAHLSRSLKGIGWLTFSTSQIGATDIDLVRRQLLGISYPGDAIGKQGRDHELPEMIRSFIIPFRKST